MHTKRCAWCGGSFEAKRSDAATGGDYCRKRRSEGHTPRRGVAQGAFTGRRCASTMNEEKRRAELAKLHHAGRKDDPS